MFVHMVFFCESFKIKQHLEKRELSFKCKVSFFRKTDEFCLLCVFYLQTFSKNCGQFFTMLEYLFIMCHVDNTLLCFSPQYFCLSQKNNKNMLNKSLRVKLFGVRADLHTTIKFIYNLKTFFTNTVDKINKTFPPDQRAGCLSDSQTQRKYSEDPTFLKKLY